MMVTIYRYMMENMISINKGLNDGLTINGLEKVKFMLTNIMVLK